MQHSKVRSRLKAQLTKFCGELCSGLPKPLAKFTHHMLFGIQASQDVKLSNIARALQEEIARIKTENRLSRNLRSAKLESELTRQLVRMGSQRVERNTVLALDLSDLRKEYARQMEHLDLVHDGSTGQVHEGYWLCDVTAAPVNDSAIIPLYQKLYSARAADFSRENAELLEAIDAVRTYTEERGIRAIDRGGDRRKLLEPLLERKQRFVIRSVGKRFVTDRWNRSRAVAKLASRCRLRHQARIVKIENGREAIQDLRYGAEPVRLPGREE